MKHLRNWKGFLLGVVCTVLVMALISPAMAALTGKNIQIYSGIKLYMDDKRFIPTDVNGNEIEVFAYNGTTYLPVRAISEAFNKTVQWEGSTSSVYIGAHSSDKPAVMLGDLDYFSGKALTTVASVADNTGVQHLDVVRLDCMNKSTVYLLNGQYTAIKGTFFQIYTARDYTSATTLSFYGDGKLLWTATMKGGVLPVDFSIDLTGVQQLEVRTTGSAGGAFYAGLADCGLYS